MMKDTFALRLRNINLPLLAGLLLLASCSQDGDPAGEALPDGQYPLQIASVTLDVEGTAQPWTRITETADGSGSTWQGGEQIGVQIGRGQPGTYTVQADGSVEPVNPVYWQSTALTYVNAWYPMEETVNLQDQTQGLAYVLNAIQDYVNYEQSVTLNFTHQLAKVRVVLSGTQAAQVNAVEVYGVTACTHLRGMTVSYDASNTGWIKMHQADATTWEANVLPGTQIDPANFIRLNGSAMATNLTSLPSMLVAGQMYTVSLTVGEPVLQDGATLTEPGTYTMQGTYTQGITIQGDGITVVMDGATVSTSGIGINVQGDATIQVQGAGNTITSSGSAGIYVAEGSTVTIEGSGRDDQLTARGGNGGAGIGGCLSSPYNEVSCGNITIRNVTVYSYGSIRGAMAAGIGSTGDASCGAITIDNATVHAYGAALEYQATPAIGSGFPSAMTPTSIPKVTITGQSEVHAHRGGSVGSTDYIGWGGISGNLTAAANAVNLGGGTCTNSTVYCYTGTGDTVDKTVVYDASGTGTERP